MPYLHTNKIIPTELKRSAKLTLQDKEDIRHRYLVTGGVSQRELAREYEVSRRTIQFTIYPERQKANYAKRVERGGSKQYYNKDTHTKAMREHRQYKQELHLRGELHDSNKEHL